MKTRRLLGVFALVVVAISVGTLSSGNSGQQRQGNHRLDDPAKRSYHLLEYYPVQPSDSFLLAVFYESGDVTIDGERYLPPDDRGIIKRYTKTADLLDEDYLQVRPSGLYVSENPEVLANGGGSLYLPARARMGEKWIYQYRNKRFEVRLLSPPYELGHHAGDYIRLEMRISAKRSPWWVQYIMERHTGIVERIQGHGGPELASPTIVGVRQSFLEVFFKETQGRMDSVGETTSSKGTGARLHRCVKR